MYIYRNKAHVKIEKKNYNSLHTVREILVVDGKIAQREYLDSMLETVVGTLSTDLANIGCSNISQSTRHAALRLLVQTSTSVFDKHMHGLMGRCSSDTSRLYHAKSRKHDALLNVCHDGSEQVLLQALEAGLFDLIDMERCAQQIFLLVLGWRVAGEPESEGGVVSTGLLGLRCGNGNTFFSVNCSFPL